MTGVHTALATCLPSILSLILMWTDKSQRVCGEVLKCNLLFHHIVQIGCLSTVEMEQVVQNSPVAMQLGACSGSCVAPLYSSFQE